ncbi:helix-turn-helix domain-containing protein [Methylomagnum ishizawai]|uniref:helix-turn-helix domain-containing protein n=1 Tax=Methylomagnum ishizawai TaxID=1760988 RepID=UPI001C341E08|nr:helix-turn-helix transcriptional regulator [Methylomagnum ishizawai]BBL73014.1 hypothetical protein MishRS11D_01120 [Methylomagnum ishizawai]
MPRAKPTPEEIGTYQPVPFDPATELAKDLEDPAFREAYAALEEEYAALDVMLNARKAAGLTQEDIARRMGTTKSAVSRLEASFGNDRHSPSLATLRKYAKACGKRLEIRLVE